MPWHLLSARRVTALLSGGKPRRHGDGGCLYLQVNGADRGSWVFMHKRGGNSALGLGSHACVAKGCARASRGMSAGRQPGPRSKNGAGRSRWRTDLRHRRPRTNREHGPGWRNAKHRAQWRMTLLGEMLAKDGSIKKTRYDYCAAIRNKPVSKLTTEDALECSSRCGRHGRRPRTVCAAAASGSGTLPRRAAIALARTRFAGAGIWTSCYQSGRINAGPP